MASFFRNAAIPVAIGAAIYLATTHAGAPRAQDKPLLDDSTPQIFFQAVEYRSPTKDDMPLPTATENVVVYQVPVDQKIRIQSFLLPLGIPEPGGQPIAPLGLGALANERTALARTVAFGNAYDLVRIEPGIVFDPGSKIVVRYSRSVKALTGSLFLNGRIEKP